MPAGAFQTLHVMPGRQTIRSQIARRFQQIAEHIDEVFWMDSVWEPLEDLVYEHATKAPGDVRTLTDAYRRALEEHAES